MKTAATIGDDEINVMLGKAFLLGGFIGVMVGIVGTVVMVFFWGCAT